jgi:hypothetical protein
MVRLNVMMNKKCKIILISLIIVLILFPLSKSIIIGLGLPGKDYFAKSTALKYSPISEFKSMQLTWVDIKNYPFYKEGIIYSPVFYLVKGTDKFNREVTVYVNNIDLKIHYIEY